jgi:tetratricopeptide (TPR) repeat protein
MLNKKNIIIAIVIVAAIIGLFFFLKWQEPEEFPPTNNNQATMTPQAIETLYDSYLAQGIKYKGEGEAGAKEAYQKAIDQFKKAVDISGGKIWIPYLNLANTYRSMGDNKLADENYNKALEISGGDASIYFAKIDFYRYGLKKEKDEIKNLYKEALAKAYENSNLVMSYAAFLRDSGDYEESLKYYEALLKSYPDNENIKEQIRLLKLK